MKRSIILSHCWKTRPPPKKQLWGTLVRDRRFLPTSG